MFLSSDSSCSLVLYMASHAVPGVALCCPVLLDLCLRTILSLSYTGQRTVSAQQSGEAWMMDVPVLRPWICVLGGRRGYPSAILGCRLFPYSGLPQQGVLTSVRPGCLMINEGPFTCTNLKCWWIPAPEVVGYCSAWCCALLLLWFKIHCLSLPCKFLSLSPQIKLAGLLCFLA